MQISSISIAIGRLFGSKVIYDQQLLEDSSFMLLEDGFSLLTEM